MSTTALVHVWGAASTEVVARQAAASIGVDPVWHGYIGGSGGEWHLAQPCGALVTVDENLWPEGDEPPMTLSACWPGPVDRLHELLTRVFDHLAATTGWGLALDVDGFPDRMR